MLCRVQRGVEGALAKTYGRAGQGESRVSGALGQLLQQAFGRAAPSSIDRKVAFDRVEGRETERHESGPLSVLLPRVSAMGALVRVDHGVDVAKRIGRVRQSLQVLRRKLLGCIGGGQEVKRLAPRPAAEGFVGAVE